jgi:hypothetical protein
MKRTLALLTALGALLVVAAVAHAASRPVFLDVDNQPQVTPHTLFLTGDGTLDVVKLSWSAWGPGPAIGTGTAEFHGCTPSCAAGKQHTERVTVRLSDQASCKGRRYYDRVSLRDRRTGKPRFTSYLAHQNWAPCRRVR